MHTGRGVVSSGHACRALLSGCQWSLSPRTRGLNTTGEVDYIYRRGGSLIKSAKTRSLSTGVSSSCSPGEKEVEKDFKEQAFQSTGRRESRLENLRQRLRTEKQGGEESLRHHQLKSTSSSSCASPSRLNSMQRNGSDDHLENNLKSVHRVLDQLKSERAHQSQPINQQQQQLVTSSMLTYAYNRLHTYLRISLTERCNLRCQYCMPPEGVTLQPSHALLSNDEIIRLAHLFASEGVNKIRLTGGEPLLRKDLTLLIQQIANIGIIKSVGITTNGITLSRHLPDLINAGLTHVNISLDTLQENKFENITRRHKKLMSNVMKSIEDACFFLQQSQSHPHDERRRVKINCVVMKDFNDTELMDFINIGRTLPVDVRFIEWMPFNDNGWNMNRFVSYKDMLNKIFGHTYYGSSGTESCNDVEGNESEMSNSRIKSVDMIMHRLSDGANDTTKWYGVPGHLGRVGFITSMSEHFCRTCNRLRITADGQLKVCLFGSEELNLRDAIRTGVSNADLALLIGAAVHGKKFALGGHHNMHGIKAANDNRPMILIGG